MTWVIALILRPFVALVVFGLILLPIRLAVQQWVPHGKLRDILLTDVRIGKKPARQR